jgi:4-amino-4-deoxy-L-arabinose transferase-like glycosyltransferase
VGNHNNLLTRLIHKHKPIVIISSLLAVGLTAIIVFWLNLPWRPDIRGLPPDSGFYAYFGEAILHGQVPYRDVWDDKPPLGYLMNALALLVFGQTPWGIWWSSVFWILGCTVLFFLVARKLFGNISAWILSAIFLIALMNPEIFQGGTLMEVYGLAPQIGIIGITYLFFTHHRRPWFVVVVGVLTACAYLIKPSTIILGCSSILVMAISAISERHIREVFRIALGFLVGFISLVGAVSVYWLFAGALRQFLDGVFLQGFYFIGGPESKFKDNFFYTLVKIIPNLYIGRLYLIAVLISGFFLLEKLYQFWMKPVLRKGLSWIDWSLLFVLIIAPIVAGRLSPNRNISKFWAISIFAFGLFLLVKFYRLRPKPVFQQVFSPLEWLLLVVMVSLPLEVLMASLGGRYFGHYFITMLPAVTVTIAYPIYRVMSFSRETLKSKGAKLINVMYVVLMLGTLVWGGTSVDQDLPSAVYTNNLTAIFNGQFPLNDLERYIVQTTKPDEEVLVWHIHLGINFITNRRAPSRFLFPLNLFIPPSVQNTKLEEYVNDIESHPPELILVQKVSSLSLPFVNQPVDQLCKSYCTPEFEQALKIPQIRQEWLSFQEFFVTHYALDRSIYDWNIYRVIP